MGEHSITITLNDLPIVTQRLNSGEDVVGVCVTEIDAIVTYWDDASLGYEIVGLSDASARRAGRGRMVSATRETITLESGPVFDALKAAAEDRELTILGAIDAAIAERKRAAEVVRAPSTTNEA